MKPNYKNLTLQILSSLAKTALVAALVLGTAWSLMRAGEWKSRKPAITAQEDGSFLLTADTAQIMGPGSARANLYAGKRNIGWWDDPKQFLLWTVNIDKSGTYKCELEYALQPGSGTEFQFEASSNTLPFTANSTGGWDKWLTIHVGDIELKKGNNQTLALKPIRQTTSPTSSASD